MLGSLTPSIEQEGDQKSFRYINKSRKGDESKVREMTRENIRRHLSVKKNVFCRDTSLKYESGFQPGAGVL